MTTSIDTVTKDWEQYAQEDAYKAFMLELQGKYEKTSFHCENTQGCNDYSVPMGRIEGIPNCFGLWMPGVALLAGHLAEKKGVQNLLVAKNMEAFAAALKIQIISHEILRFSFIVSPSFSWCSLPINYPQHKVAVVIEKTGFFLKMAILDSMPVGRQKNIDPQHLIDYQKENLWDGYGVENKFNGLELIIRCFFRATENLQLKSEICHSRVIRQQKDGCALFAILDALEFLKNPAFFQDIKLDEEIIEVPEKNTSIRHIVALPSIHMRGAQSIELLTDYQVKEPQLCLKSFSPIKVKRLPDSLSKSIVKVVIAGEEKLQNHFITKKQIKYLTWVVNTLQDAPEKAENIITRTLCQ